MKKIYSILTVFIAFNATAFASCDSGEEITTIKEDIVDIVDDVDVDVDADVSS